MKNKVNFVTYFPSGRLYFEKYRLLKCILIGLCNECVNSLNEGRGLQPRYDKERLMDRTRLDDRGLGT